MKKYLLFVLILTLVSPLRVMAQTEEINSYMKVASDYASLYRGMLEPSFHQSAWKQHPYLFERTYIPGDISVDGIVYHNVLMRYDIYRNYLSVATKDKMLPVCPQMEKIDYFTLYGKYYVPFGDMFVRVEYNGNHMTLLHKICKKKGSDILTNEYAIKTLDVYEYFYLLDKDGRVTRLKSVRDLYKRYPLIKSELKTYIKEEGISLKKDNVTQSLNKSVAFIDSFLQKEDGSAVPISLMSFKEKSNFAKPKTDKVINHVPENVFDEAVIDTAVPSYNAYKVDGNVKYNTSEEDDYAYNPVASDLEPYTEARSLDEVQVVGFRQKLGMEQSGMESFRPALLKNVPLAMGEADIMKMTLLLPGVQSTGEASSGLNVRGGSADQNLILFNNNTLFNPMHVFGVFSAFNTDLIGETQLYKGGVPAQFGGRISSVMDIKGKYADMKQWHGSFSVGLMTSKGTLELPIAKDKVSLLLSGRTTYSDWMLKKIPEKSGYNNGSAGFGDLGGVLTAKINSKHRLNVYGYYSKDHFSFTEYDSYGYRNVNGSLEWKGIFSDSLISNLAVGYDHYDYKNVTELETSRSGKLTFNINQFFVKGNVKYIMDDKHTLTFGVNSSFINIMPGKYGPGDEFSYIVERSLVNTKGLESALFAEDVWSPIDKLKLTGGLRLNMFNGMKDGMAKTYISPELRLSSSYELTEESSVKLGFNNLSQFVHKVSNTVIMCPTDTWILSNSMIKPQKGIQFSAGYYFNWNNYEFSAEAYWKRMYNLLTYRNGAVLVMNDDIDKDVIAAQGRAYGIELQVHKQYGKLNGWVNYTFSHSQMRQNDENVGSVINNGEWFYSDYDSPHNFKLVANYKFTHRYSMSVNVDYSTGRPLTIPTGRFYNYSEGRYMPFYNMRNSARMPNYFRTDLSFNIEPTHHLTALTHSWFSIGVYNLFGRKNAYSIYYVSEYSQLKSYRLSIFGAPIPFVSYNIKF